MGRKGTVFCYTAVFLISLAGFVISFNEDRDWVPNRYGSGGSIVEGYDNSMAALSALTALAMLGLIVHELIRRR
jgi:hypothetical protein